MERNHRFNADSIQALKVKLTWPQLEVYASDAQDIRVLAAGDEHSSEELRVYEKDGVLYVEQPVRELTRSFVGGRWLQVLIELPTKTFEMIEAGTVSGRLSVRGIRGEEIRLDTVSGNIRAMTAEGKTVSMRTVSGSVKAGGLKGSKFAARTVSGDMDFQGSSFQTARATTVSGTISLELINAFERADFTSVSGDVTLSAPVKHIRVSAKSISGRVHATGVMVDDEGPNVSMTGVSANLALVGTSE